MRWKKHYLINLDYIEDNNNMVMMMMMMTMPMMMTIIIVIGSVSDSVDVNGVGADDAGYHSRSLFSSFFCMNGLRFEMKKNVLKEHFSIHHQDS